jgi:NADH-quinone oxidoreductase subunit M
MILVWILIVPAIGAVLAWLAGRVSRDLPRWISLLAMASDLVLLAVIWVGSFGRLVPVTNGPWLVEFNQSWVPQFGISFHLAMDGLSLLLVALAAFLGIMAIVSSWSEVQERTGFFHFNLLWALCGIIGVFLAMDLFLFYFFWEMMLVPTYLLFLWGYERRMYAAVKFFLFTQVSGLLMLLSILGLYFAHGKSTGVYSFDYQLLLGTTVTGPLATWLMLGFFVAFAVKLPVVPFHSWLPDAYVQAPTAATVILAGIMAKTAGYGMLRFLVPLFPQAAHAFSGIAMALAVAGILYGAILAFGQTDLKRLVAYSSVSHMGFVLLGIFAWNQLALQGSIVAMIAHGIGTGALFILVGALLERTRTRYMGRMGGLWSTMPRMGGIALFFAIGALGLPGLGNFVGEFLVLVGTFRVNVVATALAAVGIIFSTVYALWMIQRVFQGPNEVGWQLPDLNPREMGTMVVLMAVLLALGLYPQPVLDAAGHGITNLMRAAEQGGSPYALRTPPGGATVLECGGLTAEITVLECGGLTPQCGPTHPAARTDALPALTENPAAAVATVWEAGHKTPPYERTVSASSPRQGVEQ